MGVFDCKKLLNEYALSCVENYLLYLIAEKEYKWQTIYCESFMPLISILANLCTGMDYSHFKGIKRLQKIAKEQGFCALEHIDNIGDLGNMGNEYYAIQVTNEYMLKKYSYEPWRNDHYVLLHNMDNKFGVEYLNDVPMDSGKMTLEEANNICNHSAIIFNIKNSAVVKLDEAIDKAIICVNNYAVDLDKPNVALDKITFEIARDAVSIAKVLIKRQMQFIKLFDSGFDGANYYDYLTSVQLKLEYMRLKKTDISKCAELMESTLIYDTKYFEKVITTFSRKAL